MSQRTFIEVEVTLLSESSTGQTVLLPPPIELARREKNALGMKKEAEAALVKLDAESAPENASERVKANNTVAYADMVVKETATLLASQDTIRDKGTPLMLKVRRPFYGEVLKADGMAQVFDADTGLIRDDRRKAVADLINQHVFLPDETTRVSIAEMEPCVGQYLEQFMVRIAYPDESRLPFSLLS